MKINFKWIGGATWILQVDNCKIACDPVLCPEGSVQDYKFFKARRLNDPQYSEPDFKEVNLWLLTHNHEDHFDRDGFKAIDNNSTIIAHKGLKTFFTKDIYSGIRFLGWDEDTEVLSEGINIKIKAMPAIHAKKASLGGMIGNGNGYLLNIDRDGSKYCVYVTGDSVYNSSIKKHTGTANIDLIITNAGSAMVGEPPLSRSIGRITNNINDIIKMNADLNPSILIPVHWGTFSHYSEKITHESFGNYSNIRVVDLGESINLSSQ
jgi:L-ascorbate metabolism protein UlaG (beta-lactamase superfamily)